MYYIMNIIMKLWIVSFSIMAYIVGVIKKDTGAAVPIVLGGIFFLLLIIKIRSFVKNKEMGKKTRKILQIKM